MATNIIPTDALSIYDAVNLLSTLERSGGPLTAAMPPAQGIASNAVIRSAIIRPNNPPEGIAGFIVDIPEDEIMELASTITDHYTEENASIQDHMALAPEKFTVTGLVAEVVATPEAAAPTPAPATVLPLNPPMAPVLAPQQEQNWMAVMAKGAATTQAITQASSLYGYFQNQGNFPPNETRQSKIAGYFYQLWKGRQLFSVETPWGVMTNMAIENARISQAKDSKFFSAFTILFKKLRLVASIAPSTDNVAGRAAAAVGAANPDQNGTVSLQPVAPSLAMQIVTVWATAK